MSKISIIIQREYTQRVKKKSFILTTLLTPLLLIGIMVAPALIMMFSGSSEKDILVIDHSGVIGERLESTGTINFIPTDQTAEEIRETRTGEEYGYLVIGADIMTRPSDLQLYSYEQSTIEVDKAITSQIGDIIEKEKLKYYEIDNLEQIMDEVKTKVSLSTYQINESTGEDKESSSAFAYGVAFVFGFLIYMFVFMYGGMVMQGVIEEKSSKVLEIMVSSVKPFELMFGKIIGIAAVALTQLAIWIVLLVALGSVISGFLAPEAAQEASQQMSMGMDMSEITDGMNSQTSGILSMVSDITFILKMMFAFALYFIGGYLLYAAMFAAVGSAVENATDTAQLQLPISMPLILAILVMMNVLHDPNGGLAFWFSVIPFTSPIVMMARLPYGVPAWEIILSLVLLYATFIGMVWVAGKIYRVGIFMYGKKPSWKELFKWISYKD